MIGTLNQKDTLCFTRNDQVVLSEPRVHFRKIWAETTHLMQRMRDNPACADSEHQAKLDVNDPGLNVKLSFDLNQDVAAPFIAKRAAPKVAILREQV